MSVAAIAVSVGGRGDRRNGGKPRDRVVRRGFIVIAPVNPERGLVQSQTALDVQRGRGRRKRPFHRLDRHHLPSRPRPAGRRHDQLRNAAGQVLNGKGRGVVVVIAEVHDAFLRVELVADLDPRRVPARGGLGADRSRRRLGIVLARLVGLPVPVVVETVTRRRLVLGIEPGVAGAAHDVAAPPRVADGRALADIEVGSGHRHPLERLRDSGLRAHHRLAARRRVRGRAPVPFRERHVRDAERREKEERPG